VTISLEQAILKCAEIELALHTELYAAMERAAVLIEREAKREIGHYQRAAGPFQAWAPLKPRTVKEKTRLGYSPPDNPLLRTGKMRADINHAVRLTGPEGMEAEIGANGVVPVVQSLGSAARNIPARDFLGHAAVRKERAAVELLGVAVATAFGVRGAMMTRLR
jgi:hypothetical protein